MDTQTLISLLSGMQQKNNDLGQIMNFFTQSSQNKGQTQSNNQNQNLTQILPLLSMLGGVGNGQNLLGMLPMLSSLFGKAGNADNNNQSFAKPTTQSENKKICLNENAKKISDYKIID